MFWYVLVCPGMSWYVLVWTGMYWYVQVRTWPSAHRTYLSSAPNLLIISATFAIHAWCSLSLRFFRQVSSCCRVALFARWESCPAPSMHRLCLKPPNSDCELSRKSVWQGSCASQNYHQCTQQLLGELFHLQPCKTKFQWANICIYWNRQVQTSTS